MSGRVVLVGAGPGDPDLLTVRALRELRRAEVLLYDALIPAAILELAAPGCERIDVGKRGDGTRGVSQDEIAKLLVEKARSGRYVVRLKGGDPFVFGRGGEEASELASVGIPFEVVPGVTSAFAVPAYAGIPVTDRRSAGSVAIVTGHRARDREVNPADWEGLARSADTLVVMMGTAWLEEIVERVIAGGRDPETPAAVIASGASAAQRVVTAPLRELAERARAADLTAPTVIVIGEVVRYRESLAWYERRPLFGRRVLVLRAREQRAELMERLTRAGAEPVSVPLLHFESAGDEPIQQPAYDWLVFASANAVRFALPRLVGECRGAVACVGLETARAARAAGLPVRVLPDSGVPPAGLADAIDRSSTLRGARVLLPRAERGLEGLRHELERRGALVDPVVVYRNVLPADAGEGLRAALEQGIDAALLTSPSCVERLAELLGAEGLRALAQRALLVPIGATTADALSQAGVEPETCAAEPSGEALVAALERHYAEAGDAVSD